MNENTQPNDQVLMDNFETFKQTVDESGLFLLDGLQMEFRNNTGTVFIPTSIQYMMEDLVNELSDILSVNILYQTKSMDGDMARVVVYSMPYSDQMFVIDIESVQYGIVDGISVTFFNSIDIMLDCLENILDSFQNDAVEVVKEQPKVQLYKIFFCS